MASSPFCKRLMFLLSIASILFFPVGLRAQNNNTDDTSNSSSQEPDQSQSESADESQNQATSDSKTQDQTSGSETKEQNTSRKPSTKRKYYAAGGSGKTLPAKVLRVRLPYQNIYGKEGFDENGNKESQGIEINIDAIALAVEYGLTDKISLAFVAPYVVNNEAGLNANTIRVNNRRFRREFGRYKDAVKAIMQSQNLCTTDADCDAKIFSNNFSIPVNQTVTLTTGETVIAKAGEPIARQIDSLLMTPTTPIDGVTGVGDMTMGGLYNYFSNDTLSLSAGLGLKIPTGQFTDVPSGQRPTGGGVIDLGLRLNFDYQYAPWGVIALQHQVEQMVAKGSQTKDSGIYNDRTNTGDPSIPEAIAIGSDGNDNNQDYEKWGLGHNGFIRFGFGLTDLAKVLQPMGLNLSYRWFEGRETRLDGSAYDGSGWRYEEITRLRFVGLSMSWDGLGMDPLVPMSMVYEYETPVSGSFATVAPVTNRIQLIGYYKF